MKYKFVEIKGIQRKIIKIDGIWVYKKHRCHCGCNERVPFKKSNKKNGIPKFINFHQSIGTNNPNYNGTWHGGLRAINTMLGKNHSQKSIKRMIISAKKRWKNPKEIEKQCKVQNERWKNPNEREKLSKALKNFLQNRPEEVMIRVKNMHKSGLNKNTKLEVFIQNFLKSITTRQFITDVTIPDYENNKFFKVDILFIHNLTIIEVNGCKPHECLCCHPLTTNVDRSSERRKKDKQRILRLMQLGFNVIVIWEHDIITHLSHLKLQLVQNVNF